MLGRVGGEAAARLLELAGAAVAVSPPRLVPGDRDVHETLEEVALLGRRRAPGGLELLVRLEISSTPDEGEAFFVAGHGAMFAGWRRSCSSGSTSSFGGSSTCCSQGTIWSLPTRSPSPSSSSRISRASSRRR